MENNTNMSEQVPEITQQNSEDTTVNDNISKETLDDIKNSKEEKKNLYILRGLAGSGKSTLAQELIKGTKGVIYSSDDYFYKDGIYKWDGGKLKQAHDWNKKRALQAFQKGITPVVIDNTNSKCWEAKFYVQQGLTYGYNIEIKEPDTPWRKNPSELAKRNKHNVPLETIVKMLERWEEPFTVDTILQS